MIRTKEAAAGSERAQGGARLGSRRAGKHSYRACREVSGT
jgi:hypothetical protein